MKTPIIPIAAGFAPADHAGWLALVEKTLKGAGMETLSTVTADELTIPPLFDARVVGQVPAPLRDGDLKWDVRAAVDVADPVEANRQILAALKGGASSILVSIDPTGARGVAVGSAAGLAQVLDGVLTDLAPVALDAGFLAGPCAQWLDAVAKASPAAPLAVHGDPLSRFAQTGTSPGPIAALVADFARTASALASTYPKASLFLASGTVAHEAGGSAPWELAFAAAAAVAYAKAMVAEGITMQGAFDRIVLGLSIDQDPLTSVAKLRAARLIWRKITSACGAETPARIEARSSRRMLTTADRWSNLVRLTSAGFAGAVGGADAVVLGTFTDAAGAADDLALRMARNTQLILMEEAHLGAVIDPTAGAWSFETLTSELARAAWDAFTTIEAAGGLVAALTSGRIAEQVVHARAALTASVAEGRRKIVGVTVFKSADVVDAVAPRAVSSVAGPDLARPGRSDACPSLNPVRLEEMAR